MPNDRVPERPTALSSSEPAKLPERESGSDPSGRTRRRCPVPVYLGHSAPTRAVQAALHEALQSSYPVLIIGAPGTGKRTLAEILHRFGGELPPLRDRVPSASAPLDGYVYINPIEDLSLDQQAELRSQMGLTRLIVGTRLDPASPEGARRLSPKLVRWCPIHIRLPSLAERIEDLEGLVLSMLHELPASRPVGGISEAAIDCLCGYHWPGNVTELEQVIAEALVVGKGSRIELRDLPARLRIRDAQEVAEGSPEQQFSLALAERAAIRRAMRHARGNKRRAARLLQIGKTTLYRKLRLYARDEAQRGSDEA
jgi:DNA-binding NtrC family response regulator